MLKSIIFYRYIFQSTHPRGVRHDLLNLLEKKSKISIHAPARGATPLSRKRSTSKRHFNPRTREGCDVSDHPHREDVADFNPRTREGCDGNHFYSLTSRKRFQSTHPRGVRLLPPSASQFAVFHFNPRTREGCDLDTWVLVEKEWPFQSTHPRGVRRFWYYGTSGVSAFQSTHPRGVRPGKQKNQLFACVFQSTHPRGVRRATTKISGLVITFQSTHPRGVRPGAE